jgi:translocation and assembly module TamB
MAQAPPGIFFAEMKGTLAGDGILLQALALKGEKLKLDGQGEMLSLPSWPDIIAGRGDWSNSRLDLRGTFDASDLGWLAKEAGLRTVRGRLQGDVNMTGPIARLALGGQLQLTDGEVRFDATMTPFKNLQASAELDGRVIRFQKISGALGGAPFQGSGLVDFEPQDGPHLVLDLKGQDLLFYRQEGLKIRADADLHAQGPLSRLEISGDMALSDGHWTKNFNFLSLLPGPATPGVAHELPLFSLRKYPWSTVRFKIKGKTRNPFQVRNNIVRGSLRPDLLLSGTGEAPVLTGVVYLDPSRIDMPAGKIFLKSGVMNFAAKDPTRPKLEVVGQARMMGYDINLAVSGTVAEPVVTLSSTPPLPEDQLLLLLLAGQAPAAGTAGTGGQRQGVLTAAVYLGQGFLSGLLGDNKDEQNQSVLERFELAVGRDVSRKGDETLDAQFRLLDLREKGAGSMYLTGNRDKFDYFNLGLKIVFRFQ